MTRSDDFLVVGASRPIITAADFFGVETATMARIFGACALVPGLFFLPTILSGLRATGPAIRIDQQGIYFAVRSDESVPWSNIKSITRYKIGNNELLKIQLIDAARSRARLHSGPFKALGFLFSNKQIVLTLQGTKGNFAEMVSAINHYFKLG